MRGLSTLLFAVAAAAIPAGNNIVERKPAFPLASLAAPEPPKLAQVVPTRYAVIDNGTRIAYRRFGKPSQFPVLYINHFRGSMDVLDPLLMNHIAQNREVILYDSIGVGHSEGAVPDSVEAMASVAIDLLAAIGVPKADVFGFSMGGAIAQYIGMEYPDVVNKLVLSGTQPANGTGVQFPDTSIFEVAIGNGSQPTLESMLTLFFEDTETSRALGRAWWNRLFERNVQGEKRAGFVEGPGINAQLTAISSFTTNPDYFRRLDEITASALVTNGANDIMAPTVDSYILHQRLPYAELHLYPDSGHGHPFQFPETYAKHLEVFLKS